ncbi:phosphate ABC transporter substrate-binding protein, PhoT family [Alteribacillus persepolensis]|uniref:Phosphate ABC transporter substrate-binding protein, PhoT family n=1 Tax=Alteribacillus persepolensis TaxID=568899 RepID=A0A1G8ED26_9BACI|nr:substrate-binding domain-containing protein [Alteribacillus persepolensis]SDH67845.1 phosphate ABC transporter substrate-binding protein, PhoT family [Alteribacillus persepolensis]
MVKRILGMLLFTVVFGFFSVIAVGMSMLMSAENGYIYVGVIAGSVFIIGSIWILGGWRSVSARMRVLLPLFIIIIPLASYRGYEAYINHIEIQQAEVDLAEYEPFRENTNVVSLEETAEFQMTENLPTLDGATALYPVYAAFVRAVYPEDTYPHHNPNKSDVVALKTNRAYERLAAQEVDIIFAAGPSSSQEEKLGPDAKQVPIGKEAFVFFVHESNPVDSVTVEELQGIYAGDMTNWKEVGGRNQDIIAFQRPEGSGSQTGLQNMMDGTPIMTPPVDQRINGMGGIIEKASDYRNHRNAVGFSYRYFATEMVENNSIKLLQVDGIKPDVTSIQQEKYPLTSEFFAITNGTDNPNVDAFIEWVLSDEGQTLIEKTGYVPIDDSF